MVSTGSNSPSDQSATDLGYTLWAVLRRDVHPGRRPDQFGEPLADAVRSVDEAGVTVRGFYDVSGLRADADLLIWLTGPTVDGLQQALRTLRRSAELAPLHPTWNAL